MFLNILSNPAWNIFSMFLKIPEVSNNSSNPDEATRGDNPFVTIGDTDFSASPQTRWWLLKLSVVVDPVYIKSSLAAFLCLVSVFSAPKREIDRSLCSYKKGLRAPSNFSSRGFISFIYLRRVALQFAWFTRGPPLKTYNWKITLLPKTGE